MSDQHQWPADRAGAPAAPAAPPGAPPAALSILHGAYAQATVGGATLNMFQWKVQYETDSVDIAGHGDDWGKEYVTRRRWTFTGQGYISAGTAAHAPNAGFVATGAQPTLTVIGYEADPASTVLFQGTGTMVRGSLDMPENALAVQEFEVRGQGPPSAGV